VSGAEHLEQMANDIGHFFQGQAGREEAIVAISNHLRRYWTPKMRNKMIAFIRDGPTQLDDLPREAFGRLVECGQPSPPPPGGDAG